MLNLQLILGHLPFSSLCFISHIRVANKELVLWERWAMEMRHILSERLGEQEKKMPVKKEMAKEFNNLSLSTDEKKSPFRNSNQWSTLIQFQ